MSSGHAFTFVDLFAGVGGFHAAFDSLGGKCVYAAEIDDDARAVYSKAWIEPDLAEHGWKYPFAKDINDDVPVMAEVDMGKPKKDLPEFPKHDILAAGFPCQAFSKSGHQKGVLDETRGTLFYNILRIVRAKEPKIVFLENVRNLAGPKHRDTTFKTIVESLESFGYVISRAPTIISPHRIDPDEGGTPQVRERIFIMAIRRDMLGYSNGGDVQPVEPFAGFDYRGWNPSRWRIGETELGLYRDEPVKSVILPEGHVANFDRYKLKEPDLGIIETWDAFVRDVVANRALTEDDGVRRLPGHPIWFRARESVWVRQQSREADEKGQEWKHDFLRKNIEFFERYKKEADSAADAICDFKPSRQKFEWQAQDAMSLSECLIQMRPSGIRVKKATYAPALVAINQTPIYGPEMRRLTPVEAARLQGFPAVVSTAMDQARRGDAASYKQLGNAVHVGAVQFALARFMEHFEKQGLRPELEPLVRACQQSIAGRTQQHDQPALDLGPAPADPVRTAADAA
ncbi:DNA (cytosine-5-)-methyltransferase [Oerskovia enterophila]|uniref:DNA (cytosine-5-)-methyltransferase n=1 Tax=Oerskovia enterophila TaxID=43678 RepID=UPI0038282A4D